MWPYSKKRASCSIPGWPPLHTSPTWRHALTQSLELSASDHQETGGEAVDHSWTGHPIIGARRGSDLCTCLRPKRPPEPLLYSNEVQQPTPPSSTPWKPQCDCYDRH